ncbi:MAG TPA: HemD protein, partial [Nitrospirae bacterium]|nr:HemD protein [Nitrospirota bacterium]
LENITELVKANHIKPPAVMVVGEVVNLRKKLKWFEDKPLFGQRILVTREHTEGFDPLEELGAEIVEFHTIRIVPPDDWTELDRAIEKIDFYNWLVLTSVNGVKFFFRRLIERERDIRDLKGVKICAIGTKTAAEINKHGIKVDLIPKEFNAEGLVEAFIKANNSERLDGVRILLPRAQDARAVFPEKIKELGGEIDVFTAYKTEKPATHGKRMKRFLKEGKITIATFTSAATFNNYMEIMGEDAIDLLKDVTIAVIGPVTAKAVEKAGLKVGIMPQVATVDAMVNAIKEKIAK